VLNTQFYTLFRACVIGYDPEAVNYGFYFHSPYPVGGSCTFSIFSDLVYKINQAVLMALTVIKCQISKVHVYKHIQISNSAVLLRNILPGTQNMWHA
jgi:hypothetical protein